MFFISINKGCRLTQEGSEYRGNISVTLPFYKCQAWTSQTPHSHEMTDPDLFPDHTIEEAQNFCRTPDGDKFGPWCYAMDDMYEWHNTYSVNMKLRCNVPYCDSINTSMIFVTLLISTYPYVVLTI